MMILSGANTVERNFIHSLNTGSNSGSIRGITIGNSNSTYRNNMIRLGIYGTSGTSVNNGCSILGINDETGISNIYHNSIYIGGSPTSGSAGTFAMYSPVSVNTRRYYNNIFYNGRSNSGSTGKHYAIYVSGTSSNPAGLYCSYNVLYADGIGGYTGLFNGADRITLADWRSATKKDTISFSSDPNFVNKTGNSTNVDLHVNSPTVTETNGMDVGVTEDYDGESRSIFTPVDIGADARFSNRAALSGDYAIGLSLFNTVAGTNVHFETRMKNVTREVDEIDLKTLKPVKVIRETEEEELVPVQDGKVYDGPLYIKRSDNPELTDLAMAGVYATINTAMYDIYNYGASGPVRFLLMDTAYTEASPIVVYNYPGSSSVNTPPLFKS